MEKAPLKGVSERAGRNANEHWAGPEIMWCERRPGFNTGKAAIGQEESETSTARVRRGIGDGMFAEGDLWQHGKSRAVERQMSDQPEAREGETGLHGMAERPVWPKKPGNAGGGKGPWFKGDAGRSEGEEIGVSLRTPESVWKLQGALHAKAKGEPSYRFYSLYDKIQRKDVLLHAWDCCRANGGGAGVDGESFEQIEARGLERWLGELAEEVRKKTYRPQAVRRVWIPKPDGKQRPLGIPTIRDRVVQMAAVIVLEPIFEADLAEEQYGYRSGRSAHDAVREIHGLLNRGYREVVDCDLSGYFDSIPHHELMKSIARRVSDGALLGLIKLWLEMPVEEDDGHGGKRRGSLAKDSGRGTPQGAPISPLLSNLYMRRFVLAWKQFGHEKELKARVVVYADDFVILCRGTAMRAKEQMQRIMTALKLTVNEKKTRIARVPEESFDFLGYTIGRCYSPRTGRAFIGTRPSRKSTSVICEEIAAMTRCHSYRKPAAAIVGEINRKLQGWGNYFCLGAVSRAYRVVDNHARHRLRQWLNGKHRSRGVHPVRYPATHLHEELGLLQLERRTRHLPWARAWMTLSESRMREIRTSGLMSGEWKRKAWQVTQAPATERAGLRYGLA
jgi:RNA-directed DNA polymerase